ncbi:MAG: HlyD family efflux transporter periplasmic adaptor subunit [Cyanobacteria bacterium J06600_6]
MDAEIGTYLNVMKILSRVANLKNYLAEKPKKSNSLNLGSEASSQLSSHKETAEMEHSSSMTLSREPGGSIVSASTGEEVAQWSPSVQSLLEEPPSNLPLQLMLGGIIFCLSFGVWAWFGEIEKVGKAQGRLVPKGETYRIESLDSARVSQIAVKEGEKVQKGQLIAELNAEGETQEVKRLADTLDALEIELEQKLNLLEKVKLEVQSNQQVARAEIGSQNLLIDSANSRVKVVSQRLEEQQSELLAAVARRDNTQQLSGLDRQRIAQIESELADHQQRLERLKPLADEGAISQEFVFQAQRDLRQAQQQLIEAKLGGVSSINEQIFQSEQSLRDMKARITENQGELVQARQESERLQTELQQKKAERYQINLNAQQKVQQIELEINQAKAKIAETKNLAIAAKSRLAKRSLISPVAGTVLSFNVVNTGKVLQPGETIAEIAPQNSPLVLSAVIPDRDAGFIEKGMTAQVKFDAYSYQDYGVIPGKVIEISADAKNDEELGAVYQVKIELDRDKISDNSKDIAFKPGQTATADIVIRRQRIMDILLDPIRKIQADGIDL